ncbi:hypothetical protein C0Q98_14360 [Streptomyces albidoflavus]|uniref:hypothetical protein n=1 Tax=Streptomyces albidoflavus TaxID=1886 RepID=UPI0010206BB5|nr:hypothetical protein [Streptomyces albidoflavus]RZE59690.1 hypothetical protein C0Q98_14360 [Streptomyces albidoflavus]
MSERHGRTSRHTLDPAAYRCTTLAAQLADEAVEYVRKMALSDDGGGYLGAARKFAAFADRQLGDAAVTARLDDDRIDLPEVIHEWETALRQEYGLRSGQPYRLVSTVLTLIAQRGHRDQAVPERLRRRAAAPPIFPAPKSTPLDEFSNAERIDLRDAARRRVRELEERLEHGRRLLETGRDSREYGWRELPNLLWAAREGLLTTTALEANLPRKPKWWPASLREAGLGRRALVTAIGGMLFPTEIDLMAFRVLLLLGMADTTPEELLDLTLPDIEDTGEGVRVVQCKARARRVRADLHPAASGGGAWDVPGLLRRLLAATATTREAFPTAGPRLFLSAELNNRTGQLAARPATFTRGRRRFTHWIAAQDDGAGRPLAISLPHDARRLRKTAKTARAAALGGTVSDLAGDDHHVEVFRGHYAHGTTAHLMAGRTIARAQQWVFQQALDKPLFIDAEAEKQLAEPETAKAAGLSEDQARDMLAGGLDMGLAHCRDPYDSPFTTGSQPCHAAPAMCMLCRNAVVFTSQLPRLLMLADHIETMRTRLEPPRWQVLWGRQAAALTELFTEYAEYIPAARQEIEDQRLTLHLPLGLRTEYDR